MTLGVLTVKRTVTGNILKDKAYEIAMKSKYDEYQRG